MDKTSTLRGWKKIKQQIISELETEYKIKISDKDFEKFWKAYEKLKQLAPSAGMRDLKYESLKEITNQMEEDAKKKKISTAEDLAIRVSEKIGEIYERQQEEKSTDNGVSKFFKE